MSSLNWTTVDNNGEQANVFELHDTSADAMPFGLTRTGLAFYLVGQRSLPRYPLSTRTKQMAYSLYLTTSTNMLYYVSQLEHGTYACSRKSWPSAEPSSKFRQNLSSHPGYHFMKAVFS